MDELEVMEQLEQVQEPEPEPEPELVQVQEPEPELEPEPVVLGAPLLRSAGSGNPAADDWRENSSYDHQAYQNRNSTAPTGRQIILATDEILGAIDGARTEVVGVVSAGNAANQGDGSGAEGVALDAEDISTLEGGTYTVVLAADQWDELRESWQWAKRGMQVYGTVLLCLTLILAMQLGISIYNAFRSRLDG